MARLRGPDAGSRYCYLPSGAPAAALTAVVYSNSAATILADIRVDDGSDTPGAVILGSQVTTDSDGQLPPFWFPDNLVDRLWVRVNGGPPSPIDADYNPRVDVLAAAAINVLAYGARGDGVTDDQPAIQAAFNACPAGGIVLLPRPAAKYALNTGLTIPPGVTVYAGYASRGHAGDRQPVLAPMATFVGTAVIRFLDKELAGYAVEHRGARLVNLTIDGQDGPAGVDGIAAVGRVSGVVLDRVSIMYTTGAALSQSSYTRLDASVQTPIAWQIWDCHAADCGSHGWQLIRCTDSVIRNTIALGCSGDGFVLQSAINTQVVGCRSEWSGGVGMRITGNWFTANGSGGMLVNAFSTDRNNLSGIYVDSTGAGPITMTGLMLRRDGRNGFPGVGGNGYAGLRVVGATMPVIVDGVTVYPGVGDDGLGVNSPDYGVSVQGSTAVVVQAGYLHAALAAWNDAGGNTILVRGLGVVGATGPTGAPVRETNASLDVPGRALGMVQPREHGLVAWSFDPAAILGGKAPVSGTVYLAQVYVNRPASVSKIVWGINTAGSGATAGANWLGLYDSAGTRLAQVGIDADVTATSERTTTITTQTLAPGRYWVAFLFNATTLPLLWRGVDQSPSAGNAGMTDPTRYRFASTGTGLTTLAATITPSGLAKAQHTFWVGLG